MKYIFKRIIVSVFTLFAVATITFFLMHIIPGGPFNGEKDLPPAIMHNLEVKFGLDKPLGIQYLKYFRNALSGNLGVSIKQNGKSVSYIIASSFPTSMRLGLISVVIAIVAGVFLGIFAALKCGKPIDGALMCISTLGTSIPSFTVASVSIVFFGVMLKLFPTYGLDSVQSYIMPVFALSLFPMGFIIRITRAAMLDVIHKDYICSARARGIPEVSVVFRHALRNAVLPVVTSLGPLIAETLTGSFIIEKLFTIPGMGLQFINSILNRDYPVILGITIFYGAFLILMNLIVDIVYTFIDPRIDAGFRGERRYA